MRLSRHVLAALAVLCLAGTASAQNIPALVEEAAQAGWNYGDNGNITTPVLLDEAQFCGARWHALDKAYSDGVFDADLVATMPAQMQPDAARKELGAWVKLLKRKEADPMATFQQVGEANRVRDFIGKAAAGDPKSMFLLAWDTRGCLSDSVKDKKKRYW